MNENIIFHKCLPNDTVLKDDKYFTWKDIKEKLIFLIGANMGGSNKLKTGTEK